AGRAVRCSYRGGPTRGTIRIRAYRVALGFSLADVVAQIRAWYASEGRPAPRFSETLLSAYESGQKRPGPEYLHYLCTVYRAEPGDLGYPGNCFCGRSHRRLQAARPARLPRPAEAAAPDAPEPAGAAAVPAIGAPGAVAVPRGGPAGAAGPAPGPAAVAAAMDEVACGQAEGDDDVVRRALLRMIAHAASGVDGHF